MFYSIFKHRKSVGHKAAQLPREHHGRDRLDGHAVHHPASCMALPATKTVVAMKDTSRRRPDDQGHRLPVEVGLRLPQGRRRGHRLPLDARRDAARDVATPASRKGDDYLLEVDNPLVVPVDKKVRIITTANDVIHAWWVPAFGVKQDAIPGFVRDTWFRPRRSATTAASAPSCAARSTASCRSSSRWCRRPTTPQWVERARRRKRRPQADDPNKVWTLPELMARGEKVYAANCRSATRPTARACRRVPGARRLADRARRRQGQADPRRAERPDQQRDAAVEAAVRHRDRRGHHLHQEPLGERDRPDRAAEPKSPPRASKSTRRGQQFHERSHRTRQPATARRPRPRRTTTTTSITRAARLACAGSTRPTTRTSARCTCCSRFTMFMVGGVLALLHPRRAVPARPAVRATRSSSTS